MKKKFISTHFFPLPCSTAVFSQASSDSLIGVIDEDRIRNSQNEIVITKIQYISNNTTKVQILQACSTIPENCGIIVTASTTVARIVNGKYSGDTLLIAENCNRTFYETNKVYTLSLSSPPSFDVFLCIGQTYNSDWNYNLHRNKYLIFFGKLFPISERNLEQQKH